jgi:hypothetical protein
LICLSERCFLTSLQSDGIPDSIFNKSLHSQNCRKTPTKLSFTRPLLNQNYKNQTHTALFGCASSVLWAPWSFHLVGFFGWQWGLRPAIWSWLPSPHYLFRVP